MLQRRSLVLVPLAAALPGLAPAEEPGWSGFDQGRPIYLEGRVLQVRWQNPQATLDIALPEVLKLPLDLADRRLPAQRMPVDGKKLLQRAELPRRKDPKWHVELAPLTRLQAWKVAEIQPGATVQLLGYTYPDEQGEAVLRTEYLWADGKAYGLRSNPA